MYKRLRRASGITAASFRCRARSKIGRRSYQATRFRGILIRGTQEAE
jgi:hypothetical protein